MFYRLSISLVLAIISVGCFAQDVFILSTDEQTPSEQRQEKSTLSARQSLTTQDYKKDIYEDLKYYFKQHQWISIGINYEGYFDEQTRTNYSYKKTDIDKFGNQILSSLSSSSFKDSYIFKTIPSMSLVISEAALEKLYSNPSIKAIDIDRMGSFE